MSEHKKVVTPSRYAQGFNYEDYVNQVKVNKERFDDNYQETKLKDDDRTFFAELGKKEGGPRKILVLGEDWCPDVFTNVPVVAKIAEAGGMEVKIFPRDENRDIMDLYLNNGNMSIPAIVFYDEQFNELGRWVERPVAANNLMRDLREQMVKEGKSSEDISAEVRKKVRGEYRGQLLQETIQEIKGLFK